MLYIYFSLYTCGVVVFPVWFVYHRVQEHYSFWLKNTLKWNLFLDQRNFILFVCFFFFLTEFFPHWIICSLHAVQPLVVDNESMQIMCANLCNSCLQLSRKSSRPGSRFMISLYMPQRNTGKYPFRNILGAKIKRFFPWNTNTNTHTLSPWLILFIK